jgi:addiction module HigA family antidote
MKQGIFGIMNDWLSPPGDTILDLIEERNWTQSQLSEHMGYTTEYINQLINGKALINEEIAAKLEQVLGSTAGFWLNREFQYRNQLTKMEKLNLYHVSADFLGENLEYGGYFDIVTYTSEKAKEMLVEWLKNGARAMMITSII